MPTQLPLEVALSVLPSMVALGLQEEAYIHMYLCILHGLQEETHHLHCDLPFAQSRTSASRKSRVVL